MRLAFDRARRDVEAWNVELGPDADARVPCARRPPGRSRQRVPRVARATPSRRSGRCRRSIPSAASTRGAASRSTACGRSPRRRSPRACCTPRSRRSRARPAVRRDAHAHLRRLLDTNSSRVVGDLLDRAQEARRQIEGEIGRRLDALHEAGARALARARVAHADGARAVEEELARVAALERRRRRGRGRRGRRRAGGEREPRVSPAGDGLLNESQRRRLAVTCRHVDGQLADLERVLQQSVSGSPFARYADDLTPAQRARVADHVRAVRAELLAVLARHGLPPAGAPIGAAYAARTQLAFVTIAIEELKPRYMRGLRRRRARGRHRAERPRRGAPAPWSGCSTAWWRAPETPTSGARLARLERAGADTGALDTLAAVIDARGLVALRPALELILDRLEHPRVELAVFGRVSSGKSSLVNRLLGAAILPVGVTPVTSVPTRIVHGARAARGRPLRRSRARARGDRAPRRVRQRAGEPGQRAAGSAASRSHGRRPCSKAAWSSWTRRASARSRRRARPRRWPTCPGATSAWCSSTPPLRSRPRTSARSRGSTRPACPCRCCSARPTCWRRPTSTASPRTSTAQLSARLGAAPPVHPVSVVEARADLLDRWQAEALAPIVAGHAGQARAAVERRIGALREAVAAALRARLAAARRAPDASDAGDGPISRRTCAAPPRGSSRRGSRSSRPAWCPTRSWTRPSPGWRGPSPRAGSAARRTIGSPRPSARSWPRA